MNTSVKRREGGWGGWGWGWNASTPYLNILHSSWIILNLTRNWEPRWDFATSEELSFFSENTRDMGNLRSLNSQSSGSCKPALGASETNGTAHKPACLWGAVSQLASVCLNHTDVKKDNLALLLCVFWEQVQDFSFRNSMVIDWLKLTKPKSMYVRLSNQYFLLQWQVK